MFAHLEHQGPKFEVQLYKKKNKMKQISKRFLLFLTGSKSDKQNFPECTGYFQRNSIQELI